MKKTTRNSIIIAIVLLAMMTGCYKEPPFEHMENPEKEYSNIPDATEDNIFLVEQDLIISKSKDLDKPGHGQDFKPRIETRIHAKFYNNKKTGFFMLAGIPEHSFEELNDGFLTISDIKEFKNISCVDKEQKKINLIFKGNVAAKVREGRLIGLIGIIDLPLNASKGEYTCQMGIWNLNTTKEVATQNFTIQVVD